MIIYLEVQKIVKIITVNIAECMIDFLDQLAEKRLIPSRSEAVRQLINLGMPMFLKQLDVMREIEEILLTREQNKVSKTIVKVPRSGEFFAEGMENQTYNIVRRLE